MQATAWRVLLLMVFSAVACSGASGSEEWPQRPVKIIVPYAAGGNSDEIGRLLAPRLSEVFGQPFIIENRPGASGAIAAEAVARAPADGYTLFFANLPQIAIMPAAMKTSFNPLKDVVPISVIATNPLALVVNPGLPVRSVAEFVTYARAQHGQLTYAAVGVGSITHLAMTLFMQRAGIEMSAIMYKGGSPAVTDVIAGHVKAHFAIASNVVPHATTGMLRLLAISGEQRMRQVPDVPTMIESGYPGFKMLNWTGVMARAGTPTRIIDRISKEISRAVKDPVIAARLTASGVDLVGSTPEDFAAMIAADVPLWAEAVRGAGVGLSER
jgi:tripartite-type tricarboxylate transporter receptor subunit TctC